MIKFHVELWAGDKVLVEVDTSESGEILMTLDGNLLDPRIVEWAIQYGLRQGIRDAGAAEKDDAARNAKAWKRIDALVNNTLREGGGGGAKLTPVEREMRAIVETQVRLAFDNPANAAWVSAQLKATGLGVAELRDAVVKAKVKADDGTVRAQAEARLKAQPTIDLGDITITKAA